MSSTRSVMWCRPGPRRSRYLAIGESPLVASRSSSAASAGRDEVRPHPLRRYLLGRLDGQAERVAIEREGLFQLADGDADVIERRRRSLVSWPPFRPSAMTRVKMPSAAE